jgi:hypothetical protein
MADLDITKPREGIAAIMREAGSPPQFIHAFLKTGLLVGEDSPHSDEERKEWMDAVQEWFDQKPANN